MVLLIDLLVVCNEVLVFMVNVVVIWCFDGMFGVLLDVIV